MNKRDDWMPGKRDEQLAMSKNWLITIKIKGKLVWKMEQETIDEFEEAVTYASDENARPQKNRNQSTNVLLKEAFAKLSAAMRDMKRRYF